MKTLGAPTVFLSYAHEDRPEAERLYSDITAAGLSVWFDRESLLPGQQWKPAIRMAIRNVQFFVALMSSRSTTKRGFVNREFTEAFEVLEEFPESAVFLIPVRLDDCEPSHRRLMDLHRMDLFPDWEVGLTRLLRALGVTVPRGSPAFQVTRMSEQDRNKWLKTAFGLVAAIGTLVASITAIRAWNEIDITSFSVEPLEIKQGERVRLKWNVNNASQVKIIPNIGTVNSIGSRTDAPIETTIYRLVAEKFIFKKGAEFEIVVKTVPGQPRTKNVIVQFTDFNSGIFLKGNAFSDQGIQKSKLLQLVTIVKMPK